MVRLVKTYALSPGESSGMAAMRKLALQTKKQYPIPQYGYFLLDSCPFPRLGPTV